MRRSTVHCRIVNCYVQGEMGVNGDDDDDGRMVLVLRGTYRQKTQGESGKNAQCAVASDTDKHGSH